MLLQKRKYTLLDVVVSIEWASYDGQLSIHITLGNATAESIQTKKNSIFIFKGLEMTSWNEYIWNILTLISFNSIKKEAMYYLLLLGFSWHREQ